jgi:hypothetical protein
MWRHLENHKEFCRCTCCALQSSYLLTGFFLRQHDGEWCFGKSDKEQSPSLLKTLFPHLGNGIITGPIFRVTMSVLKGGRCEVSCTKYGRSSNTPSFLPLLPHLMCGLIKSQKSSFLSLIQTFSKHLFTSFIEFFFFKKSFSALIIGCLQSLYRGFKRRPRG